MAVFFNWLIGLKEAFLAAFAVLLAILNYYTRGRKNFPPGPRCLPLVGFAPFLGENPSETIMALGKKYGPIFPLKIGTKTFIVLNSHEVVHEALVSKGHAFSGRNSFHIHERFTRGLGIAHVDYGDFWRKQRKFGAKALRRFGMGKVCVEEWIAEEVGILSESFRCHRGKAFDCQNDLSNAVASIICRIVMGRRFSNDEKIFVEASNSSLSDGLDGRLWEVMVLFPMTRFLPVFWGSFNRFARSRRIIEDVLRGIIGEHQKTFRKGSPRDVIDEFFEELLLNKDPGFNENQLVRFLDDVFTGGTETISTTLRWSILALALNQSCQERVSKEITEAIGETGCPNMRHRDSMPYTCAFIHEITRHRPVIPLTLLHKTNEAVTLAGHHLAKNTPVIPHIWSVHYDPEYFKNPEEFCPERFLDGQNRFVPSTHVIPYSIGPRYCLGEQLARTELFLFLTGLLQKFRITPDPAGPLPPLEKGVFGPLYAPDAFKVVFSKR